MQNGNQRSSNNDGGAKPIIDQSFSAYASYKGSQHGSLVMSRQTLHSTDTMPKNNTNNTNDSLINQSDIVYQSN